MNFLLTIAEFETYMIYIWLGVFILMVLIEAATTDIVTIWFAAAAIFALILSAIPGVPFWVEILVFIVISIVSLLLFRPLVKKYLTSRVAATNADSLIGRQAKISKDITPLDYGALVINGVTWTALSEDNNLSIASGSLVEITGISGNKLIVKTVDSTPINHKED